MLPSNLAGVSLEQQFYNARRAHLATLQRSNDIVRAARDEVSDLSLSSLQTKPQTRPLGLALPPLATLAPGVDCSPAAAALEATARRFTEFNEDLIRCICCFLSASECAMLDRTCWTMHSMRLCDEAHEAALSALCDTVGASRCELALCVEAQWGSCALGETDCRLIGHEAVWGVLRQLQKLVINHFEIPLQGLLRAGASGEPSSSDSFGTCIRLEWADQRVVDRDLICVAAIMSAAGSMMALEHLNLERNPITDAGVRALTRAIRRGDLPSLRQLWLTDTLVTKVGVEDLSGAIAQTGSATANWVKRKRKAKKAKKPSPRVHRPSPRVHRPSPRGRRMKGLHITVNQKKTEKTCFFSPW